jgi:hypothetical protein
VQRLDTSVGNRHGVAWVRKRWSTCPSARVVEHQVQQPPRPAARVAFQPRADATWGSLLLAGERLNVGNVAGTMTVLGTGRQKHLLGQIEMDAPLYSPPAVIGDSLYLDTATRLYLIAAKP